ncbi:MAG TPA: tetratricopeptide repeat protein, partial [Acidobacteriota bacterium]|nr:tetratricopeptide repeat protein [Acidobacteriota bacterium]
MRGVLRGSLTVSADGAIPRPKKVFRRRRQKVLDSIAILPLQNESADAETEYLSDGITESIINTLSQIPRLRVMARSTVFRYKGKPIDPLLVGQELRVAAVFSGRVEHRADQLYIQMELADASDGARLWGETFQRRLSGIFELQEEIAREISSKLRVRLLAEERKRLTKRYTQNTEAYKLYLRGRFYWNKRTEEGFRKAIEHFELAILEDPEYALAYAGLSDCYGLLGGYGYIPPINGYRKAREYAAKALDLDSSLAEAHASMAVIHYRFDWNWSEAEKAFVIALQLNPGYMSAHQWYAVFLAIMQRFEEAEAEIQNALELDPLSLILNWTKGYLLFYMRRYDEAVEQLRRTLDLEPNFIRAHFDLGLA